MGIRDRDDVVNVFIYANMEDKIRRIKRMYHLGDRQRAAKMIRKTEKIRRNYYQYYTCLLYTSRCV